MMIKLFLPGLVRLTKRGVLFTTLAVVGALAFSAEPISQRGPFYILPTVEGLYSCDKGAANPQFSDINQVNQYCIRQGLGNAAGINRLLDELEPGGPQGQVQVGYGATLQLLSLYQRQGKQWVIDDKKLTVFLQVLTQVKRPVMLYLAADHFDSQGPLVDALIREPRNLMLLSNGQPTISSYFGYRVVPYTLDTDPSIPVNRYRYAAMRHVAKRLAALPKEVRDRIVAITLLGELHHMFPEFESGTGQYDNLQVTDYSPNSVRGFHDWLAKKYLTVKRFNEVTQFSYASFSQVPAPSKNIRKGHLTSFGEHFDAYADGQLPIAGWLWDPQHRVKQLLLFIDGKAAGTIPQGFNRLDVYRAVDAVTHPNVGFRFDYDFSQLGLGQHFAQVLAQTEQGSYLLGARTFAVIARDQSPPPKTINQSLKGLASISALDGVKSWMDKPTEGQDLYFNPLARDWHLYRADQVKTFMTYFYKEALQAGLPKHKLFSHQIMPTVNSSWNPQLFAAEQTLKAGQPWHLGINLYGGATDSEHIRRFLAAQKVTGYGVPEFNPQQWKQPGAHLAAMKSHDQAGARFISPYYLSVVPDRFKGAKHAVNRMELRQDNPNEGSDQFFAAIKDMAKQ